MRLPIVFLLGPTAAGKTPLAIELVQQLPLSIISVDSAMVYKGMDIGTAKPSQEELQRAPHALIDMVDPAEAYSAGRFQEDALTEIERIHLQGKIPFLVGGTMMYFNILQRGLADLPVADEGIRAETESYAAQYGWPKLHEKLQAIDPKAAARIHPNDQQRIQRALEVYQLTGKTITELQTTSVSPLANYDVHALSVAPAERSVLHERIAQRFEKMLAAGFKEEVESLYQRGDLHPGLAAIRSVGYYEVWQHLAGEMDLATCKEKAIAATRQLAKRQLTWLRSWPNLTCFDSTKPACFLEIKEWLEKQLLC